MGYRGMNTVSRGAATLVLASVIGLTGCCTTLDVSTLKTGGTGTVASPWTGWDQKLNSVRCKNVYLTKGHYLVPDPEAIRVRSGTRVYGDGLDSVLVKRNVYNANRRVNGNPILLVENATGVKIDSLRLMASGGSRLGAHHGNIQVDGNSTDILIDGVSSGPGYAGIWVKQGERIEIVESVVDGCSHNVVLGGNGPGDGGPVRDVEIRYCEISNAVGDAGSDGVKTKSLCKDIRILWNQIKGNRGDGIDLFAGGDTVLISHNDIEDNRVNGIDIKVAPDEYPEVDWGRNRHIEIIENTIRANDERGVKIYTVIPGEYVEDVNIVGNTIVDNRMNAVAVRARDTYIARNRIVGNCKNPHTGMSPFHAIHFIGFQHHLVSGGLIEDNEIEDNGTTRFNAGVFLQWVDGVEVIGNRFDSTLPTPVQNTGLLIHQSTGSRCRGNVYGAGPPNQEGPDARACRAATP